MVKMSWRAFEVVKTRVAKLLGWGEPQESPGSRPLVSRGDDRDAAAEDIPVADIWRRVSSAPTPTTQEVSFGAGRPPLAEKPVPSGKPFGRAGEQRSAGPFAQRPTSPHESTVPPASPADASAASAGAIEPNYDALQFLERLVSETPSASSPSEITSNLFSTDLLRVEEELERLLDVGRAAAYARAGGAQLPKLRPGRLVCDLGMEDAVAFGRALKDSGVLTKFMLSSRERVLLMKAAERRWLIS